ncbi:hypothetical protein D2V93_04910 [Flagellimonas taeanensis]|uniref:TspO and MBR related proteins n=1 Tax=Flagellimonas taeanensis TaxID=1005926 RepID=A0A1M6RFF6_9FLAO|nr:MULTISPECIES: hypothetical protein [Allomuricauda]MDC6386413.1 hypothetical protein [Muricauda sp. SK9]RIV51998.1 hypothetical protein D2V93_04910 [Allomuricauda taeanensis]SFB75249.1 hypothetical protein SAMN04487891_10269 [Allomuricauda taeanensis]SHK31221.1 hypothetical protein SAMN05216293_0745 [Allomuricauda taeanensis]
MDSKKYLDDISQIKDMMSRSSRFISLTGLSGILAGIYAITGATVAYLFLLPNDYEILIVDSLKFKSILGILILVAVLSFVTAYLLTTRKAKRNNEKIWDETTKRLLINFFVPMVTGGIYILIKLNSRHYGLTASLMLIFYGLALVNASKYTIGTVQYLGYSQIVLGLICAAFPGYGFWFWVLGFGVLHIVYGTIMHFKEDRK